MKTGKNQWEIKQKEPMKVSLKHKGWKVSYCCIIISFWGVPD